MSAAISTEGRPGHRPQTHPARACTGGVPMRLMSCLLVAGLLLVAAPATTADEKSGADSEGFIQKWLVLAPIPLGDSSGSDGLDKEAVKGEADLKPKAGDKVKAGDKDLAWKAYTAKDHLLDFNAHLGGQTEDSIAYAVAYVTAPADMTVKMKTGSDDQCKVWLNGKEVFKYGEPRPTDKD